MMRRLVLLLFLTLAGGCLPGTDRAEVLYLSPLDSPEIWGIDPRGGSPRQLTHSGGMVHEFTLWPDGSRVLYAAGNALGGTDLWQAGGQGGEERLLLECGGDRCAGAAVSPDGKWIAYDRRNASENPGGGPGLARVWLMEVSSGDTRALFRDARVSCEYPAWSPDGLRLSCYDVKEAAVRVHLLAGDEGGRDDRLFPTRVPHAGSWTADSAALIYTDSKLENEMPRARILRANVRTGETTILLAQVDALDYSPPAVSPEGTRLALGVLLSGVGQGKDLWVVDLAEAAGGIASEAVILEEDPLNATTACRWSPDGQNLACQQYPIGMADAVPNLVVWDVAQRSTLLRMENAALPAWLRQ